MESHRKRKPITTRVGSWIPKIDSQPAYSVRVQPLLQEGDLVQHVILTHLNQGRPLQVLDTSRTEVLCHYIDGPQQTAMLTWYPIDQLLLVHSAKDDDGAIK